MKIKDNLFYIGVDDFQTELFEGQYKVPSGMCYNSYLIKDEKIAVMDTVDGAFRHEWLDNIENALNGKKPDYLVVQHMEPDHSANVKAFAEAYPEAKIVSSKKAFEMMKNFYGSDYEDRRIVVSEGDALSLGGKTLTFIAAPMVHWPEVIMTYLIEDKVLFTADGFGKFGSFNANEGWADEAARYYIGIVGKYGAQVQQVLKKAAQLEIEAILPLHGPVLTENLGYYIDLYNTWSSYSVEKDGVAICYTSVYGNTERAAQILAEKLKEDGCKDVVIHDLARCDMSLAVADAFRYEKLVLATTTYNGDVFPFMKEFINHLTERNYQNRTVALIDNGSWAPMAAKIMKNMLSASKNIVFAENEVKILSAVNDTNLKQIEALSSELCKDYKKDFSVSTNKNDGKALFNIGYGLYVVTTKNGDKDNGFIVNTVSQLTDRPKRVSVTVNKQNYSYHLIKNTGILNVNCLSESAPFKVFEKFGFKSGRNVDKFDGCSPLRSDNGLVVLPHYINSFMSLKVEDYIDLGTHGMFICSVTEAQVINDEPSMTYSYYQKNVKPKPNVDKKAGYVCTVCGYVYEGENLPEDFVCPICKHGASDFEKI